MKELLRLIAVGLCLLAGGCELGPMDSDGGSIFDDISEDDIEELQDEVERALRRLFPDLSDEEIADVSGTLSLDAVLALKEELEAIREDVEMFSGGLFLSAEERVMGRQDELAEMNDGFPEGLEAVGRIALYDEDEGTTRVQLSGVLDGRQSVQLDASAVAVSVDGQEQAFTLQCLPAGRTVDIVFLIDITGSMSNVIDSVRDSVVDFIGIIESSGLRGTVSVVTFQDTVGVNRTFQQPSPPNGYERSPFFRPVAIDEASGIDALRSFVNRLEANAGADAPENLAGAVDFARNNVIGVTAAGEPNVIGDGRSDPAGTDAFAELTSEQQVFVVLTDVTFHGDDDTDRTSSLEAPFIPRDAGEILATLHQTGTVVHVSDPSWSDHSINPTSDDVDADYWAIHTGGLGEDRVAGYSLVDLELVVVAEGTGLLDITLDKILTSSCTIELETELTVDAQLTLDLTLDAETSFTTDLVIERF